MQPAARKLLYWSPRVLCILFAAFITIFAFDVFEGNPPLSRVLLDLALHLLPTALLLAVLAAAWRREWIAGVAFLLLAVAYVAWAWGRFPIGVYLIIGGPLLVLSALFFLGWKHRLELRPA